MKNRFSILTVSLALLSGFAVSCSESDFKGAAEVGKPVAKQDAPAVAQGSGELQEEIAPPPVEELASLPPGEIVEAKEEIFAGICREKLVYDPSEILCAIKEKDKRTVWELNPNFSPSLDALSNKEAFWISPLATVTQQVGTARENDFCPFVPGSDKAIYVSHFTLDADQIVTVEAVIDDIGQVRLWKNADPSQEVFISSKARGIKQTTPLTKGFYTVVMDAIDTGAFASGAIGSVLDASGKTLVQTESSTDWCIFRVTVDTDIPAFLSEASSCRSCMVGAAAAGASTP